LVGTPSFCLVGLRADHQTGAYVWRLYRRV
jgi:hypothetical protein